jgi:multiple sugar transport system ATP-binding protein
MAQITLDHATKVYPDGTRAVSEVDLEIPDGSLVVLVGPSGCGKTTLLRMVAGLETITEGVIRIGDRVINDLEPKDRDIAMVFQSYALYPHMSVYGNMSFSLKMRRTPRAQMDTKVRSVARILGIDALLEKKPKHLSGGQRQRVAMGRAIVREPQVFLMDEPLSNLDAKLRVHMRAEIARVQRDLGTTMIYVTHDQTEAMTLGDLVAVMKLGVVQQVDTPQGLYRRPQNLFVAGFIGSPAMNLANGRLDAEADELFVSLGQARLRLDDELVRARPALRAYVGHPVIVGIRPEDMEDAASSDHADAQDRVIKTRVELREELGAESYVHFTLDAAPVVTEDIKELAADTDVSALDDLEKLASTHETRFIARMSSRSGLRAGEPLQLLVDTSALHFYDPDTGQAIYERPAAPAREVVSLPA